MMYIHNNITFCIVSGDNTISIDEFTHVDPSVGDVGIIRHCRRRWCVTIEIGCLVITIGTKATTAPDAPS